MKEFKSQLNQPHFKFTQTLKWSAFFIAIYLVIYGLFTLCLSYYSISSIDMTEMPEGADDFIGSPFLFLLPVLFGTLISTIILVAFGLVVGLILKTD